MAFVPIYIFILFFTIVIDYYAGLLIAKNSGHKRKLWLVVSLVANVGVLAVFKYYNFINHNISHLLSSVAHVSNPFPYLAIALPIGLSFHTFQAMSYTIEVYRGKQQPERKFGIYALYVMFYPQLVAGPIERPQNILYQFYLKKKFNYENVSEGLKRMLMGFLKKIVIADRLSIYVNSIYNTPAHQSGAELILATIFFSFQIYCDFSGYSDIAIGAAKVMGFDLMENFNIPYLSKSISEFWSKWHMSLSTWFRDYVYIPLGGSRVNVSRHFFNLFIVFLLSGLWHGANWTYVIWGGLNGIYLIFAIIKDKTLEKYNLTNIKVLNLKWIGILITYLLICFSWIFFRANSLIDAILIIKKIFGHPGKIYIESASEFNYSIMAVLLILIIDIKGRYFKDKIAFLHNRHVAIRYVSIIAIVLYIVLFGVFDSGQFIYFQF
jgi:D-alanyl-lipoteichoic acid acyltransferase DltB (MBOAT superfamily)